MLTNVIPSYLYLQYADDEDLQAFIRAYNTLAQNYIDAFNTLNLPIYTSAQINGYLLDWVAAGLYGLQRATIGTFNNPRFGPINTWALNTITFNGVSGIEQFTLSDDAFKRVITWHFYKGDGKVFNIVWLKRRIERFLFGANGSDYNSPTYRISVSFDGIRTVIIRIINRIISSSSGSLLNRFLINSISAPFNTLAFTIQNLPKIPMAEVLKRAIDSGVLELPFQFNYIVVNE